MTPIFINLFRVYFLLFRSSWRHQHLLYFILDLCSFLKLFCFVLNFFSSNSWTLNGDSLAHDLLAKVLFFFWNVFFFISFAVHYFWNSVFLSRVETSIKTFLRLLFKDQSLLKRHELANNNWVLDFFPHFGISRFSQYFPSVYSIQFALVIFWTVKK